MNQNHNIGPKKNARQNTGEHRKALIQESRYSTFDQPAMCLFPSSANLSSIAATSRSAGAVKEPQAFFESRSTSVIPSTVASASFTERTQPPQVIPGSLTETVWVPSVLGSSTSVVAGADSAGLSAGLAGVSAGFSQPAEMANNVIAISAKRKRILILLNETVK